VIRIFVTAKPAARENRVEKIDETHFKVWVKAPPDEGRANQAVIEALAEFLKVPKSRIEFLSGHKSKQKVLALK
jgi:uncharacterized protein